MAIRQRFSRHTALVGASILVLGLAWIALAPMASAANSHDRYRWPWRYGETWTMTQGWNGATSHQGGLYYAIDVDKDTTSRPVMSAEEGTATCTTGCNSGFGNFARIVNADGKSSIYAHMVSCFSGSVPVVQGFQLGNSGMTGDATAIHIHFQVQNNSTGFTSVSSPSRALPGSITATRRATVPQAAVQHLCLITTRPGTIPTWCTTAASTTDT